MKKSPRFSPGKIKDAKRFSLKEKTDRASYVALYKTAEWVRYRATFLKHNPKCYACAKESEIVDHVKPHKGNVELFENVRNHIPLCKKCHDYCTGQWDRKDNPDVEAKIRWIDSMRMLCGNTSRVKILSSYRG